MSAAISTPWYVALKWWLYEVKCAVQGKCPYHGRCYVVDNVDFPLEGDAHCPECEAERTAYSAFFAQENLEEGREQ